MMKRFAKTVYIRLRGCIIFVIRGMPFSAPICPHEDQAAPPPLSELSGRSNGRSLNATWC